MRNHLSFYWRPVVVALAIWSCFAIGMILGCSPTHHECEPCSRPCCEVEIELPKPKTKISAYKLSSAKTSQEIRHMRVTAYCTCPRCCGKWSDGYAASGVRAKGKLIAADKRYPFGTVMTVPGYGTATVQDRGGAIKGDKLDLLFPSHAAALQWGVKWLDVTIESK